MARRSRTVTYQMIPEHERRAMHHRVAEAMERMVQQHGDAFAAMLAFHREQAAEFAPAARQERGARSFPLYAAGERRAKPAFQRLAVNAK